MQTINVRETREKLSALLDAVAAGEEIVIMRHGKPAAKLTASLPVKVSFPDRGRLRNSMPPSHSGSAETVRKMREDERF